MGNILFKKTTRVAHYQQIIIAKPNNNNGTTHLRTTEPTNILIDENDSSECCPICFEPVNDNYITYCCKQKIHKQCLEQSYNITNHTCPICRTDSLVKKTLIKFYINIQLHRIKKQKYLPENSEDVVNQAVERVNQIMSRNQIRSW